MTDSDALTIARWCWPTALSWACKHGVAAQTDGTGFAIFDSNERGHVATVEAAVIERGLAEEYGHALAHEMWPTDPHCTFAVAVAQAATAPPSARVKALAAVIRAQEVPDDR